MQIAESRSERALLALNQKRPSAVQLAADLLQLLRPANSLAASALVVVGAQLTVTGWPSPRVWLAALAMWCVTSYGYVSNDCADLAEDRINKPNRPLPAGAIPLAVAVRLSKLLAALALLLALYLGWREALVAGGVLALLSLYNRRLKSTPGGGNLLIAGLAGCTLITGGVAAQGIPARALLPLLAPVAYVTLFVAAREVVKTLEDQTGDRSAGRQTLAILLGPQRVVAVVGGLALLNGAVGLVTFFAMRYSVQFLLLTLAGIQLPLFFTVWTLWRSTDLSRVKRCLRLLKLSYVAGVLALLLA